MEVLCEYDESNFYGSCHFGGNSIFRCNKRRLFSKKGEKINMPKINTTVGCKKKRVFYLLNDDRNTYIKEIGDDYVITTTRNPADALRMRYMELLPKIRMIEAVNCCVINVRSIDEAISRYGKMQNSN